MKKPVSNEEMMSMGLVDNIRQYLLELGYGYVIQGHVSVPFSVEWCCVNFLVIDSLALWFRLLVGPERHSGAWRRICS